jgi:hypothetical protein
MTYRLPKITFPLATFFILWAALFPTLAYSQDNPYIAVAYPYNTYVDPRAEVKPGPNNTVIHQGINQIQVTFSAPVCNASNCSALTSANFHLSFYRDETRITASVDPATGLTPSISSVSGSGFTYTLNLSSRIPLRTYTVIQPRNIKSTLNDKPLVPTGPSDTNARLVYGFLPTNVSGIGVVNANDITEFLICLSNSTDILLCSDMDRDAHSTPNDITTLLLLLHGVAPYQNWSNEGIGNSPNTFICTNNSPPTSVITSPLSADVSQNIPFYATMSTDQNGIIIAYEWDFGDGTKKLGPTTTHSYSQAGTYSVTLSVTDNCGANI